MFSQSSRRRTRSTVREEEEEDNSKILLKEKEEALEAAQKKHEDDLRDYLRREADEKQKRVLEDATLAHLKGKEKKKKRGEYEKRRKKFADCEISKKKEDSESKLKTVKDELKKLKDERKSIEVAELKIIMSETVTKRELIARRQSNEEVRHNTSMLLLKDETNEEERKAIIKRDQRNSDEHQKFITIEVERLARLERQIDELSTSLTFEQQYFDELKLMPEAYTFMKDEVEKVSDNSTERWELYEKMWRHQTKLNNDAQDKAVKEIADCKTKKGKKKIRSALNEQEKIWEQMAFQHDFLEQRLKAAESDKPAFDSSGFAALVHKIRRDSAKADKEEEEEIEEIHSTINVKKEQGAKVEKEQEEDDDDDADEEEEEVIEEIHHSPELPQHRTEVSEEEVADEILDFKFNEGQKNKLQDLLLRNKDKGLADLKKDILKYQDEEALEPVIVHQKAGAGESGYSKATKKPDDDKTFFAILRIGLINVLKVDATSAEWLLKNIDNDMKNPPSVQEPDKIALAVNTQDPSVPLQLTDQQKADILQIVNAEDYEENKQKCQDKVDQYARANNLPNLTIGPDKNVTSPTFHNMLDKWLSKSSGAAASEYRTKISEKFRSYAPEPNYPKDKAATKSEEVQNPLGGLTIETSHSGVSLASHLTPTVPCGSETQPDVSPHTPAVLQSLVSPAVRQDQNESVPNKSATDNPKVSASASSEVLVDLQDFSALAAAAVQRDLATLTDNTEVQKLMTAYAEALVSEGILELPEKGVDEVVHYNENVQTSFLSTLRQSYDNSKGCKEGDFAGVVKLLRKKLLVLFITAHAAEHYELKSTIEMGKSSASATPEPEATTATEPEASTTPEREEAKVPQVGVQLSSKKKGSSKKKKVTPKDDEDKLKVSFDWSKNTKKIAAKKARRSTESKASPEPSGESGVDAEKSNPVSNEGSAKVTDSEKKRKRKSVTSKRQGVKPKKQIGWKKGTADNENKSLGKRKSLAQAVIPKFFQTATKVRATLHTENLRVENLLEDVTSPDTKQQLLLDQTKLKASLQLVHKVDKPVPMSQDELDIQFSADGELRLSQLNDFLAKKEKDGVKVGAKKLKEVTAQAIKGVEKEIDKVRAMNDGLKMVTNALMISALQASSTFEDPKEVWSYLTHFKVAFNLPAPHVFTPAQENRFRKVIKSSILTKAILPNNPCYDKIKADMLVKIQDLLRNVPPTQGEEDDQSGKTEDETEIQPEHLPTIKKGTEDDADHSEEPPATKLTVKEPTTEPEDTKTEEKATAAKVKESEEPAAAETCKDTSKETTSPPPICLSPKKATAAKVEDSGKDAEGEKSEETHQENLATAILVTGDNAEHSKDAESPPKMVEETTTEPKSMQTWPAWPEDEDDEEYERELAEYQAALPKPIKPIPPYVKPPPLRWGLSSGPNSTALNWNRMSTSVPPAVLSEESKQVEPLTQSNLATDSEQQAVAETSQVTHTDHLAITVKGPLDNPEHVEASTPQQVTAATPELKIFFGNEFLEHTPPLTFQIESSDNLSAQSTSKYDATLSDDKDMFDDVDPPRLVIDEGPEMQSLENEGDKTSTSRGSEEMSAITDEQQKSLSEIVLRYKEFEIDTLKAELLKYQEDQKIELSHSELFLPYGGEISPTSRPDEQTRFLTLLRCAMRISDDKASESRLNFLVQHMHQRMEKLRDSRHYANKACSFGPLNGDDNTVQNRRKMNGIKRLWEENLTCSRAKLNEMLAEYIKKNNIDFDVKLLPPDGALKEETEATFLTMVTRAFEVYSKQGGTAKMTTEETTSHSNTLSDDDDKILNKIIGKTVAKRLSDHIRDQHFSPKKEEAQLRLVADCVGKPTSEYLQLLDPNMALPLQLPPDFSQIEEDVEVIFEADVPVVSQELTDAVEDAFKTFKIPLVSQEGFPRKVTEKAQLHSQSDEDISSGEDDTDPTWEIPAIQHYSSSCSDTDNRKRSRLSSEDNSYVESQDDSQKKKKFYRHKRPRLEEGQWSTDSGDVSTGRRPQWQPRQLTQQLKGGVRRGKTREEDRSEDEDPITKEADHTVLPKHLTKRNKMRRFRTEENDLNDLKQDPERQPHKKTKIPVDKESALYLASTCENPYNLPEFFTEPSHKGVYVFKGTYQDRSCLRAIDAFKWRHESSYNPRHLADKNAVIIIRNVGEDKDYQRNPKWTKTCFFSPHYDRWVVQYLGDPKSAIRDINYGFGASPSDSGPDDFINRPSKSDATSKTSNTSADGKEKEGETPAAADERLEPETAAAAEEKGFQQWAGISTQVQKTSRTASTQGSDENKVSEVEVSAQVTSDANTEDVGSQSALELLQKKIADALEENKKKNLIDTIHRMTPATPIYRWEDEGGTLDVSYARRIINDTISSGVGLENALHCSIVNPQGGHVYVLKTLPLQAEARMIKWKEHVLIDGHRWITMRGQCNRFDKLGFERTGYRTVSYNGFTRWVYFDWVEQVVMVHYIGDASQVQQRPHGSDRNTGRDFIRHSKIIQHRVYDELASGRKGATEIYNAIVSNAPGGLIRNLVVPRNPRAVQYQLEKKRLNQYVDDAKGMAYIAQQMPDFVRTGFMLPHKSYLLATTKGIENFRHFLQNAPRDVPIMIHYDTTFKHGDFFTSAITYRLSLMETTVKGKNISHEPIMPLFLYLHERRPTVVHKEGWNSMKTVLENILKEDMVLFNDQPKVLVTDREFPPVDWPNCPTVYCWNHIRDNIERKLMSLRFEKPERTACDIEFVAALRSTTEESYNKKMNRLMRDGEGSAPWTHPQFVKYYMEHIDKVVRSRCGRWVLMSLNIPNSGRGITNNAAESFNNTMAPIKTKRENLMHQAVIKLRYVFDVHDERYVTAIYGLGMYQLKVEYRKTLQRKPEDCPQCDTLTPEQHNSAMLEFFGQQGAGGYESEVRVPEIERDFTMESIQKQAQWMFDHKKIDHVPSQNCYLAMEPNKKSFQVILNPPECACGRKTTCSHMLAVKRFNGSILDFAMYKSSRQNALIKSERMGRKTPTKTQFIHKGYDADVKTPQKDLTAKRWHTEDEEEDEEEIAEVHPQSEFVTDVAVEPKTRYITHVDTPKTPKSNMTPAKSILKLTPGPKHGRRALFQDDETSSAVTKSPLKRSADEDPSKAKTPPSGRKAKAPKFVESIDEKVMQSLGKRTKVKTPTPADTLTAKKSKFIESIDDKVMASLRQAKKVNTLPPADIQTTTKRGLMNHGNRAAESSLQKTVRELADLGYYLNEHKEVKVKSNGKETKTKFKYNPKDEAHYEAVANKVTEYVHGVMETKYNMRKFILQSGQFVYVSNDYLSPAKTKMTVIIHGMGAVQSGVWARKLCLSGNVDRGSQLDYIRELVQRGHSVVCTNTNQPWPENPEKGVNAFDHLRDAYVEVILSSPAKTVNYIAFSAGGAALLELVQLEINKFRELVPCVVLLDSAHDKKKTRHIDYPVKEYLKEHAVEFVHSREDNGEVLHIRDELTSKTISAGTEEHDSVPYMARNIVIQHIDHVMRYRRTSNGDEKPTAPLKQKSKIAEAVASSIKAIKSFGKTKSSADVDVDLGKNKAKETSGLSAETTQATSTTVPSALTAPATKNKTPGKKAAADSTQRKQQKPLSVGMSQESLEKMYPIKHFDVESFNLSSYKRHEMALSVGHSGIFNHPSGFQVGITCNGNGVAIAFYDNSVEKEIPGGLEELRNFVAATVSDHAHCNYGPVDPNEARVHVTACLPTETSLSSCQSVRQKIVHQLQVVGKKELALNTNPAILRGYKNTCVLLHCYERLPADCDAKKMIKCETCKEMYHINCVPIDSLEPFASKGQKFSCLACSMPYRGVGWGAGGVVNTCTIDNTLTCLAVQQSFNPQFIDTIPASTPEFFRISIQAAIEDDDALCHESFYQNYLTSAAYDPKEEGLYGSAFNIVYETLYSKTFQCNIMCSEGCSKNGRPFKGVPFLKMEDDWSVHSSMFLPEGRYTEDDCPKCKYIIKKTQTIILNDEEGKVMEPLILPIVFDQVSYSARFLAENLVSYIVVSDQHFDFCNIIVNQIDRKHYMSLMRHPSGNWLAYDGLHNGPRTTTTPKKGKSNHFRLAKTSDWCSEYSKVFSVEYIRNSEKTLALQNKKAMQEAIAK